MPSLQTPDFEEYPENVTGGILSKKEKESVKAELFDHLLIKYELLSAQGKSEEEALRLAEESLGSSGKLRHDFSLVHSYCPDISIKKH